MTAPGPMDSYCMENSKQAILQNICLEYFCFQWH